MSDQDEGIEGTIFDIFADPLPRHLLLAASDERLSAEELADRLGVARPTIYRNIDVLIEHDLLSERMEIDENGHHYRTFKTNLKKISFEIRDSSYVIRIDKEEGLGDRFRAFWSDLERSSARTGSGAESHPDHDLPHD